ncbi:hypothetical protein AAZX31_20G112600 [Glycine max]|uniref:Uncharacterized protein n=2 Tax=Glycine subgen. Soja TaxID=1462606 RepID=K7N330_SOYBN|nr:hypothetical protein JHK86_056057 [Glycine max]KAG4918802.1 hypothetical protein JHK85_057083 [Glycine max]KAG5074875.1 hypothetical protein JHK84_056106 [Glycine max]KAG5077533.1 hypothetical protein JHK82_056228 [Glycine max]KAH1035772.1 hypothetical protein GYH30_055650 [Glycine max]
MACSLSSFCTLNQAFCRHNSIKYPKIRFQSFSDHDNGKRANIVDANLSILRERIQQVRKRESLIHTRGWNYKHSYDHKYKRDSMISQSAEIIGLSCGVIGLVFIFCSLSIFLLSLLVCI